MSLFIVVTKEAVNNIQINTHTVASTPFFASVQTGTESKVTVTCSSESVEVISEIQSSCSWTLDEASSASDLSVFCRC